MKFGPERRVRKRPEFQAIQRAGRRVSTKNFVLIISHGPAPDSPSRLGITASKRVGNAVRRNRLKRLVRAAFRARDGWLPVGHDLVVICKRGAPDLTSDTVVQEWNGAAKRLKKTISQLGDWTPHEDPGGKTL
jgi:ribonuclease P protein component